MRKKVVKKTADEEPKLTARTGRPPFPRVTEGDDDPPSEEDLASPEGVLYTRAEAARLLGKSVASIKRYQREGILRGYLDHRREWRFKAEDIENFVPEADADEVVRAQLDAVLIESTTSAHKAANDARAITLDAERELLSYYTDELKQVRAHYAAEQERLVARVQELERERKTMWELLEAARSQQHARDLERIEVEEKLLAQRQMRGAALSVAEQALPLMFPALFSKSPSAPPESTVEFSELQKELYGRAKTGDQEALKELLLSATDEQVEWARSSGYIPEAMLPSLLAMRDALQKEAAHAAD